ncbi:hypothetical protein A3C23_02990 [Candidatus Roizmanbacteria bacterium RIFCSPHIGHO2_02_FULL_37_13b]|uniref:HNH endonuclease n=1 Tax=Candidatus Roizmanbacteria bacterium RIFCSPLOWO2_02_FULL_36_11 TaxID=1802071 RepID=A0A1F7JI82_9BACT|nr:MAG: hypothetical protein A3C23_02990 [Candidatus Roizmanbacteria bacterium RIFCSPHIGHO2_02_FULL_37_13b]OGK55316.1 MAG: hypothetical protein A3H78_04420 [Candidatus Roizmanbacteria bacterium RIFCSPLOWO2_02_FULL_36_11]
MNKWNIPSNLEDKIRDRDKFCVYCHSEFNRNSYTKRATWEHIDNNAKNISETNIALCCASCNASKGTKKILSWFNAPFCRKNKINMESVADMVKSQLNLQKCNLYI